MNDREFIDLLKDAQFITEEQEKSLMRKYKKFDFQGESVARRELIETMKEQQEVLSKMNGANDAGEQR